MMKETNLKETYYKEKVESTADIQIDSNSTSSRRNFYFYNFNSDFSSSENRKEQIYEYEISKNSQKISEIIRNRNYVESQIRAESKIDELVSGLEERLAFFDQIAGDDYSFIEKNMIDIEKTYSMKVLGNVIQTIYIKNYDNSSIMSAICKALMRYDLDEVSPWGPTMLAGLINHPSELVKEYVVELIDNWEDAELLPILSTIEIKSQWLSNYIHDVVIRLEKNVLSKKAI